MRERRKSGIWLVVIGLIFLIHRFTTIDIFGYAWKAFGDVYRNIYKFWPILLILLGIYYIFSGSRNKGKEDSFTSKDYIRRFTIFSGLSEILDSSNFKGANIVSIFGGAEIDLTNVTISRDGCEIKLFALFGGVEIKLPEDSTIDITGIPIFGGSEVKKQNENIGGLPLVKVRYLAMFGGVEIK